MANQISPEAISDILAAIGSHPDGASLQDVAKALKTEVPLRTLQYRLRLLVTDGRITKVADGRWTRYQLPRVGVTGDEPDLGSDVRYIAISKESDTHRAYDRSASRYRAVRQSLGEPNPVRLRYRTELRSLIADIIRARLSRKEAAGQIASFAEAEIEANDRDAFIEISETELSGLHAGNFARYQVRPSEFEAWQQVWNDR